MSTSIQFTDNIGAAILTNLKPFPGDRFSNWTPITNPFGDAASRQSDGATTMFVYRDDYGASFELSQIPSKRVAGVSQVDIADRLRYWLTRGGTCQINTGDVLSSVYATVGIMPGTKPDLTLTDRIELEYTLRLSVLNVAASPARMVCYYADQ